MSTRRVIRWVWVAKTGREGEQTDCDGRRRRPRGEQRDAAVASPGQSCPDAGDEDAYAGQSLEDSLRAGLVLGWRESRDPRFADSIGERREQPVEPEDDPGQQMTVGAATVRKSRKRRSTGVFTLYARSPNLDADRLLVLTDVSAVMRNFGTPAASPLHRVTIAELADMHFPPGSMGPKVEACRRFTADTGRPSLIGALDDAAALLSGAVGTTILA